MSEAKKNKKLSVEEATVEVFRLFARGLTRDYILEHAKANKWELKGSELNDVIEKATERLIEIAGALNLDTEVGKALTRLETLYKDATDATPKDIKTALAVQKEINQLLRLREHARHSGHSVLAREPAKRAAAGRLINFSK